VTRGDERDEGGEAAGGSDEQAELVARVREELEAARRRVRDAWVQYQQRATEGRTREAVGVPPLLTALLDLIW
jgi:hypothetical protein